MRLWFETGGRESKFKSVTALHMMDQWRCQGALVDKITVSECFPLLFTFSSTFAKVRFTFDIQINFRNGVTVACFSLTTIPHEKEENCRIS